MNVIDRQLWGPEATDDTTSTSLSTTRRMSPMHGGPASPRRRLPGISEQQMILTFVSAWGPMLEAHDDYGSILRRFEEVATDVTSWEVYEGVMHGLQGVVAVPHRRPELFRMTIDISPGSLPRRKPRFAFLDQSGPHDDE